MPAPRVLEAGPITRNNVLVPASLAITKGDFIYDTEASGLHKPFSALADQLTPAKNQMEAARLFVGIAGESRTVNETRAESFFPVDLDMEVEYDCDSATFEENDLVAPVEASSGTALENQKVAKTTSPALAIGRVTKRYSAATTRVQFRCMSRKAPHSIQRVFPVATVVATETLAGDRVLTTAETQGRIVVLDPGGAGRNVDMPAVADNAGAEVWIRNAADAAEVLTIRHASGGATICTPTQNETAILRCDGTTWYGVAVFHN